MSVARLVIVTLLFSLPAGASFWTEWTEDPGNPVLDPASGVRAYYPSVVHDGGRFSGHGIAADYKMWFASPDSGVGGIAMAYSDDGVSWTEYNSSLPLSGLVPGANHPVVIYDADGFGGGMFYRIWYWDTTAGLNTVAAIRVAQSADGITWVNDQPIQQHATDAALQLVDGVWGSYFFHCYGPGTVLYHPDGSNTGSATPDDRSDDEPMSYRYVLYYDNSPEGALPGSGYEQTSLAYSTDGLYWIRHGDEPVLIPSGNTGDWDGMYSYRASVLEICGTYHMWYSGANGDNSIGTYYAHGIGHAVSSDGLSWSLDGDNPALHVSDGVAWRNVRTYTPAVVHRTGGAGDPCLEMWFTGRTGSNYTIGFASACGGICFPEVTTAPVTDIAAASAAGGGEVTADGGFAVTVRGVCWATFPAPTLADACTDDGGGLGVFASAITGLEPNTAYFLRAYASNSAGTAYGGEVFFQTLPEQPTVITLPVTDVTTSSASSGGEVLTGGGLPVSARGVCWAAHPAPTLADTCTDDGSGLGVFASAITGLSPFATYHLRAYASNDEGTAYGEEISFTTAQPIPIPTLGWPAALLLWLLVAWAGVLRLGGNPRG